jgi:hypothetical protein
VNPGTTATCAEMQSYTLLHCANGLPPYSHAAIKSQESPTVGSDTGQGTEQLPKAPASTTPEELAPPLLPDADPPPLLPVADPPLLLPEPEPPPLPDAAPPLLAPLEPPSAAPLAADLPPHPGIDSAKSSPHAAGPRLRVIL